MQAPGSPFLIDYNLICPLLVSIVFLDRATYFSVLGNMIARRKLEEARRDGKVKLQDIHDNKGQGTLWRERSAASSRLTGLDGGPFMEANPNLKNLYNPEIQNKANLPPLAKRLGPPEGVRSAE